MPLPIERGRQPFRRDQSKTRFDEIGDFVPIGPVVQPDPDPAFGSEIGRAKKALRFGRDQHLLIAGTPFQPDLRLSVASRVHGEDFLADAERFGIPRELFECFRQFEADLA